MKDAIKRGIDVVVAVIILVIISPVLAATALAIRLSMGSPVVFRHVRPGLHAQPFTIFKFRSMLETRDADGILRSDEERSTRLGTLLRNMSLDELPQFWNVLRGDMSLVGPRPLLMEYLPLYTTEQARRHFVRPGITGWAQIHGRNELSWDEKFKLDLWYVDNRTTLVDLHILLWTIARVIARDGISQTGRATTEPFRGVIS